MLHLFPHSRESVGVGLFQGDHPVVGVDEAMGALPHSPELAGLRVHNPVGQTVADAAHLGQAGFHPDALAVAGHGMVLAGDGEHRADDAPPLHLGVADANRVQVVGAGLLHPADVVGMVGHLHLVGLVILYFMDVAVHVGSPRYYFNIFPRRCQYNIFCAASEKTLTYGKKTGMIC